MSRILDNALAFLPQLGAALDPLVMARRLGEHLSAGPADVMACTVEHVRYRHQKCCVIGYRLRVQRACSAAPIDLYFSARVLPGEASHAAYQKASTQPLAPTRFSPPVFHLADLGMVAWAFPNDKKLAGLHALSTTDIRHYVPEHGCTARVVAAGGEVRYAKCYPRGAGAAAHAIDRQLWAARAFAMPEPLGFEPEHEIVWRGPIAGRTLLECWSAERLHGGAWQATARAVAALHQVPVTDAPRVTGAGLAERLDRVAALAVALAPDRAALLARLVRRLQAGQAVITRSLAVTLHGDLHPENILLDGTNAALLDFDAIAQGPAVLDLGSFSAALLYHSLVGGRELGATYAALEQFIAAYEAAAGRPVDRRALRWATAYALAAERAYRAMTRMKPGRDEIAGALIALALEFSEFGGSSEPRRVATQRSAAHG